MRRNQKKTYGLRLEELEPRALLSTFYVAPAGTDAAAGLAQAPWQTLQHAANVLQAGDTVIVEPGTYQGFELTTSGTAAAPITFQAQPGVVINQQNPVTQDGINLEGASYVTITGFTVQNMPRAGIRAVTDTNVTIRGNTTDHNGYWGIFTGFSNYVDIENNTATNSQIQHGIYVSNSAVSPVIRNNLIYGNADNGIHLNGDVSQGGSGIITGALVEGNVIHDNGTGGGSGINCDGVQNSTIENNLLYNNHASGISLYRIDASDGSKNNVVANNTIVMASDARWALNIQDGSTGNTVLNNILYDNNPAHGSIDISADSLPGFSSDGNAVMGRFTTDGGNSVLSLGQWQAATGQDGHSLVSTPAALFVNAVGNDYHLSATSPAVGKGVASLAAAAAPTTDLSGSVRAGNDIGAYAYQTAGPDQPHARRRADDSSCPHRADAPRGEQRLDPRHRRGRRRRAGSEGL
jgi:parallel beta-helix repeat protein